MPRRRWRLLDRRATPTAAERHYLETGELPPRGHPERAELYFFSPPGHLKALWRTWGARISAEWAVAHEGAQPWAQSRYGAPDA